MLALSGNVVADVSLFNDTIGLEARVARATTSRLPDANKANLLIDATSDHVINFTEAGNVSFTVSGLGGNETGTVTFTDTANHQVVVNVGGNGRLLSRSIDTDRWNDHVAAIGGQSRRPRDDGHR